jgi:hypothetical protein
MKKWGLHLIFKETNNSKIYTSFRDLSKGLNIFFYKIDITFTASFSMKSYLNYVFSLKFNFLFTPLII